jgi:S1-C subfamily serine protease
MKILALTLALLVAPLPKAAPFTDVPPAAWYYEYVELLREGEVVHGHGDGTFAPDATITRTEAWTMAANLAQQTANAAFDLANPYSEVAATRAQLAVYINAAVGETEPLNPEGEICDVAPWESYADAVHALYRAGILTGSDGYGTFRPDDAVTRAEAAAMVARAVEPALRIRFTLPTELPAEVIYERGASAVISLDTYNSGGELIRSGSAFLISPDGTFVTNLHVLAGAYTVVATTRDGAQHRVLGAVAWSAETNVAVLKLERGAEPFAYLTVADSTRIRTGLEVYSLGSPVGLGGTLSSGVLSYTGRVMDDQPLLQFTSAISQGSGGGALLDGLGRVVGVTSSSFSEGEHLNFAVPVAAVLELPQHSITPVDRIG